MQLVTMSSIIFTDVDFKIINPQQDILMVITIKVKNFIVMKILVD